MPADVALAGLILPTLVTNISQAFRQGWEPAAQTARDYHRFLIGTVIFILISAQLFWLIARMGYLLLLGVPVTLFAGAQLLGLPLALRLEHRARAEWVLGVIRGLYGGISGIGGPPLLVYLLSINAPKIQAVRAQGVVFLIGAIALLAAHLGTGLMQGERLWFSVLLVPAARLGMTLGYRVRDRLDQVRFRHYTESRPTGAFILFDESTNNTVRAGMIVG